MCHLNAYWQVASSCSSRLDLNRYTHEKALERRSTILFTLQCILSSMAIPTSCYAIKSLIKNLYKTRPFYCFFHPATFHLMKYFSSQMPRKEMEEIVRDEMRTAQVVIPLAYNDEKLALTTSTDGAIIKDQCARPQNLLGKLNVSTHYIHVKRLRRQVLVVFRPHLSL